MKRNEVTKKDSALAFALVVFLPIVVSFAIVLFLGNGNFLETDGGFWFLAIASQLTIGGVGFGYLKVKNISIVKGTRLDGKISLLDIGLLAVLGFVFICLTLPLQSVVLSWIEGAGLTASATNYPEVNTLPTFLLSVVILAVVPAVTEELVYRGIILNGIAKKQGFDIKAVLFASFLFAIMHQNPAQTLHPFLMGVVMGSVYLLTRSLRSVIVLHFFNNFFVLLVTYLTGLGFETFVIENWWWVCLLSAVVTAAVLWYFFKKSKSKEAAKLQTAESPTQPQNEMQQQSFALPERKGDAVMFFTSGIAFCIIMWVFVLLGMAG